jgi:hypothetical protein
MVNELNERGKRLQRNEGRQNALMAFLVATINVATSPLVEPFRAFARLTASYSCSG